MHIQSNSNYNDVHLLVEETRGTVKSRSAYNVDGSLRVIPESKSDTKTPMSLPQG